MDTVVDKMCSLLKNVTRLLLKSKTLKDITVDWTTFYQNEWKTVGQCPANVSCVTDKAFNLQGKLKLKLRALLIKVGRSQSWWALRLRGCWLIDLSLSKVSRQLLELVSGSDSSAVCFNRRIHLQPQLGPAGSQPLLERRYPAGFWLSAICLWISISLLSLSCGFKYWCLFGRRISASLKT